MSGVSQAGGPLVESRPHKGRIDGWLILATLLLLVVGLMSLYSIDYSAGGSRHFSRQLLRLAIGGLPLLLFLLVNPKALQRNATAIYLLNLGLLALVLIAGQRSGGAQRWVSMGPIEFQPSEMAKLLTVITLAAFFAQRQEHVGRLGTYALSLLHIAVPLGLIFVQPHLGASLAILIAWLGVSLVAGVRFRYLAATVLGAAALLAVAFTVPGVLKDYQLERVRAMFGGDPQGSKFQVLRAQYAFAAGGLTGVGYLKGEQKRAGFVPEQHTDFIFTVIGEEGGLVGCTLVLAAFGFFFYRIWLIILRASDPFYRLLAAGIYSVLAFHALVNIGMNLELLPVVGLWLPFMSYGGTAIWLCLASVGLLLNIRARERPVLF